MEEVLPGLIQENLKIACIEEIACRNGWISYEKLRELGRSYKETAYGEYLLKISNDIKNYGQ